jgi:hypothetical protein
MNLQTQSDVIAYLKAEVAKREKKLSEAAE